MATTVPIPADAASPSPAAGPSSSSASATPLSSGLAVLLPLSYVVTSLAPHGVMGHFAMVPVNTFLSHRYLWNVATHVLVEPSLPLTIANVGIVVSVARTLELEWSTPALALYLLFTALVTGFTMLFMSPALSAAFNAPYAAAGFCGFLPCAIALAIAHWQRGPQGYLPGVGVRNALVPFGLVSVAAVAELLVGPGVPLEEDVSAGATPLGTWTVPALVGLVASWFYLRFLRDRSGDASAAMAFDGLFPGPLRVLARALGRLSFPLVRCCGLGDAIAAAEAQAAKHGGGKNAARDAADAAASSSIDAGAVDLPGSTPSVADRRRQVALQALAERLQRAREQGAKKPSGAAGAAADAAAAAPAARAAEAAPAAATAGGNATPLPQPDFSSPQIAPVAGRRTPTEPREAVDF